MKYFKHLSLALFLSLFSVNDLLFSQEDFFYQPDDFKFCLSKECEAFYENKTFLVQDSALNNLFLQKIDSFLFVNGINNDLKKLEVLNSHYRQCNFEKFDSIDIKYKDYEYVVALEFNVSNNPEMVISSWELFYFKKDFSLKSPNINISNLRKGVDLTKREIITILRKYKNVVSTSRSEYKEIIKVVNERINFNKRKSYMKYKNSYVEYNFIGYPYSLKIEIRIPSDDLCPIAGRVLVIHRENSDFSYKHKPKTLTYFGYRYNRGCRVLPAF